MIMTVFTGRGQRFYMQILVFILRAEAAPACWAVFMAEEQRYTVKKRLSVVWTFPADAAQHPLHMLLWTSVLSPPPPPPPTPAFQTTNVQRTRCRRRWRAMKHAEKTTGFELVKGCSGSVPLHSLESPTSCVLPAPPPPSWEKEWVYVSNSQTPKQDLVQLTCSSCDNIYSCIFDLRMEERWPSSETVACNSKGHRCCFHADNSHESNWKEK